MCVSIAVPRNGYLTAAGDRWTCLRGYKKEGNACIRLKVPVNAHIGYLGNDWRCNEPYRRDGERCVQPLGLP